MSGKIFYIIMTSPSFRGLSALPSSRDDTPDGGILVINTVIVGLRGNKATHRTFAPGIFLSTS